MATFTGNTVEAADGSGGPVFVFDTITALTADCPVTKVVFGNDAEIAAAWSFNTGPLDDGTPRVTLATDDPAVAALEAIESYLDTEVAAILTAVELIDDVVETDRFAVNLIAGQAGITAGAGAVAANTPRVTLASDDPAVNSLSSIATNTADSEAILNSVLTVMSLISGAVVAHDAAVVSRVMQIGLGAASVEPTAVTATGDATRALGTLLGKQVTIPYAIPASTWQYASLSGGVTDTADDEAKAAAGGSIRNYITHCSVVNGHATVGTEVVIKNGSVVIWRSWAQAGGGGVSERFDPPLRCTANTAVNVANITTGSATYFNLQGFVAAE